MTVYRGLSRDISRRGLVGVSEFVVGKGNVSFKIVAVPHSTNLAAAVVVVSYFETMCHSGDGGGVICV